MALALVFGDGPWDRYRSLRTVRWLARAGIVAMERFGRAALAAALAEANEPVWLVRAGAWPAGPPAFPPPSRTGRALAALGAVRPLPDQDQAGEWKALLARTGGDLGDALPALLHSLWAEAPLARALAEHLVAGRSLRDALAATVRDAAARAVRFAPLDVYDDPALRVAQLVTSLQQGGAERVAIDLAGELPGFGVRAPLLALGAPTRAAFPAPPGAIDLSWERDLDRDARAARLGQDLVAAGIDLVHGHLLEGADVTRLSAGPPLLVTVHNVRAGWPAGTEGLAPGEVALLVGCSRAAEDDLRGARLPAPVRTVWNGIDLGAYEWTAEREAAGRAWRDSLGLGAGDFVLVCVANARPQKRLHLLPAVLAATRTELARRGSPREVGLVFAGAPSRASEAAREAEERVRGEVARLRLDDQVRWVGSVDDVASLLAAGDVLVSTSAHEGLSLAQIEALAMGLPVVATDAGGTREIAQGNPALHVLPLEAPPGVFAAALADLASTPRAPSGRDAARVHFGRARMAEGYARLYPRAVEASRGPRRGDGLLLVTNNFSTGGAQSSARRLLLGLAAEGARVRAAVLEEQPEYPTPGRRALAAAGIPVLALPPPGTIEPADAVARLLQAIDADPPAAVLLWNVIAEHKLLLADALLDLALFDVSPGEMYFASLERYFERPRPGLPYRMPREYGARLAGVIVKYQGELARAAATLGAPVHVIPNGVPLGEVAPARPAGERLAIGTLARLAPHKRIEDLIDALRRANGALPPHVLRIAGGVEPGAAGYASDLTERAHGLSVEWMGELGDPRPFLQGLDLFALVAEPAGCPNASLEAMAAGLPVVATDVGGAREQVEDGVTGRIVPPRDAEAFARVLVALAHEPEARLRFGSAGRRRTEDRFDVRRMVADYQRVCLDAR